MVWKYNPFIKNGTQKLVCRSNGANIIMGKQYFKPKKHLFRHVLKYKIRQIAYSYNQEKRLNYVETFTAIIKSMSYKCFYLVRVKHGYQICHIDVITAWLYNFLNEIIHVKQPYLFVTKLDKVCKLIKALYRLNQAPNI